MNAGRTVRERMGGLFKRLLFRAQPIPDVAPPALSPVLPDETQQMPSADAAHEVPKLPYPPYPALGKWNEHGGADYIDMGIHEPDLQWIRYPALVPAYDTPMGTWHRSWGDIHINAFFHTGAVVDDWLVVKGWGIPDDERGHWNNRNGLYAWNRRPVVGPIGADWRMGGPLRQTLRKSLTPLVPVGTDTNNPALLLVPEGKYEGLMLGQLTQAEKRILLGRVGDRVVRKTIKEAAFWPESHALRPPLKKEIILDKDRLLWAISEAIDAWRETGDECGKLALEVSGETKNEDMSPMALEKALERSQCVFEAYEDELADRIDNLTRLVSEGTVIQLPKRIARFLAWDGKSSGSPVIIAAIDRYQTAAELRPGQVPVAGIPSIEIEPTNQDAHRQEGVCCV